MTEMGTDWPVNAVLQSPCTNCRFSSSTIPRLSGCRIQGHILRQTYSQSLPVRTPSTISTRRRLIHRGLLRTLTNCRQEAVNYSLTMSELSKQTDQHEFP